MLRKVLALLLILAMTALLFTGCQSKSKNTAKFPTQEINIIVPYKAGGGIDTSSRFMAKVSEEVFGQKMIIVNREGGNTLNGANDALKAKRDGHTIIANTCTGMLASPQLYNAGFNPVEDFVPIISQGTVQTFFVAGPNSPVKDLDGFIKYAKEHPGQLTVGVGGLSDITGIAAIRTLKALGLNLQVVPFNGAAESVTNLLGKHVDYAVIPSGNIASHVEAKTIIPLYETGGMSNNLYNVKSISDLGYPDAATPYYRLIMVPKGASEESIKILREGFTKILNNPEVIKLFNDAKDPLFNIISDPEALTKLVKKDYEEYGKVIKELNLKQ